MFARMIDDVRESTGTAMRLTSLALIIAIALFVTLTFLSAAAFVYMLQTYGLIPACLTDAAIFLVVALIAIAVYAARKQRARQRAAEAAKSAVHSALADPVLVATGIQVARAIGIRKLVPLLAIGGLALGLLASRGQVPDQTPAE